MKVPYKIGINKFLGSYIRSAQLQVDRSFVIEMTSPNELRMCGVLDVKNYDNDNILISTKELVTEINGKNMIMSQFSDCEITVSGEIFQINFLRR